MNFNISAEVSRSFRNLAVSISFLRNVSVRKDVDELGDYISEAVEHVKKSFNLEQLTTHPLVRAYRDFFWRVGVDPTKTRPSAEALLRRVLRDMVFPRVNSLVDVYNAVSMKRLVPVAAFDAEKLSGNLYMRFARRGELFHGIGMEKPLELEGKEVVVEDSEKLVAVYPYRDADSSKITEKTRDALLMVCGVPGVGIGYLEETSRELVISVSRFCGGELLWQKSFQT